MTSPTRRSRLWWLVVPLAALALWAVAKNGDSTADKSDAAPSASAAANPSAPTTAGAPGKSADPTGPYDPADYAAQVRAHAREAGVNPVLLMAILYNESYKPHDPSLERAWQNLKPDAAFGIANMHKAAFEDTKRNRDFADRDWSELPDDRDLAVEAAAWYLHDLEAQLPSKVPGPYTRDELAALGYNAGSGNMLAFARGVKPGSQAQSYLDKLRATWDKAEKAVGPPAR